jgi:hypothetical protein
MSDVTISLTDFNLSLLAVRHQIDEIERYPECYEYCYEVIEGEAHLDYLKHAEKRMTAISKRQSHGR